MLWLETQSLKSPKACLRLMISLNERSQAAGNIFLQRLTSSRKKITRSDLWLLSTYFPDESLLKHTFTKESQSVICGTRFPKLYTKRKVKFKHPTQLFRWYCTKVMQPVAWRQIGESMDRAAFVNTPKKPSKLPTRQEALTWSIFAQNVAWRYSLANLEKSLFNSMQFYFHQNRAPTLLTKLIRARSNRSKDINNERFNDNKYTSNSS